MNTLTAAIMGLTAAITAATPRPGDHHRRAWTHRVQRDLHSNHYYNFSNPAVQPFGTFGSMTVTAATGTTALLK